jgi:1-acyl-sn-glycerol-3-phosphate acyltransferase
VRVSDEPRAPVRKRVPVYALRDRLPFPLWHLYRLMRTLLVASAFVGFWTGGTLLAWLVLPLVALGSRGREATRACQRVVARSFRLFHGYMSVTRLMRVHLHSGGVSNLPKKPAVFVANHATLVDVTALFATIPDLCCVARAPFDRSPFVGRLLALAGFISAGRSVAERAACVDEAVQRLNEGFSVLVFPEGSRSPEGELHRFHRGPFEMACRANVPVIPLVLSCNPSALRKDQRSWAQPDTCAELTIDVEEPRLPAEFGQRSRRMREAIEASYRSRLVRTSGAGGARPEWQ